MDNTSHMKLLLEAVDSPKVDLPKSGYANTPKEQTLDSAIQQGMGNDLHKSKPFQQKRTPGDNPRAAEMREYKLKEEARLTSAFNKFKLNESADLSANTWETGRELGKILRSFIDKDDDLEHIVGREQFANAHKHLMMGHGTQAVTDLMANYTDRDGGDMHDDQMVFDGILEDLNRILSNRITDDIIGEGDYEDDMDDMDMSGDHADDEDDFSPLINLDPIGNGMDNEGDFTNRGNR
jgi:hypothetical protein